MQYQPESVAIVLNSYFGPFMLKFAEELQREWKARLHLYCKSSAQVTAIRSSESSRLFASINDAEIFFPALRQHISEPDSVISEARKNELDFGIRFNTLAVANRHVGRGYALGGSRHPRSRYSNCSYHQMVNAYNVLTKFWTKQILEKKIELVIADDPLIERICNRYGVAYRTLARSRIGNLHYWETTAYREALEIKRHFENLGAAETATTADEEGSPSGIEEYQAAQKALRRHLQHRGLYSVLNAAANKIARHLFWRLRGHEKANGYFLWDEIWTLWKQRAELNELLSAKYVYRLEELKRLKFLFYALHAEPEQALGRMSPEYYFQLEAIASISQSLPTGYVLVVKENPIACGRRPRDFYRQLREFKNVVFADIRDSGREIIKLARGVVTISGTVGLEAAAIGIPVISFGRHNPYNCLEHVYTVTDLANLPQLVDVILSRSNGDDARYRSSAKRYIRAVKLASFDMGSFDYVNLEDFAADAPRNALGKLIESMEQFQQSAIVQLTHT